MISLLPSRESHITSVLEKYARNVTATHSGTWSFLVSNPSTGQNCPVQARQEEDWLVFRAPLGSHQVTSPWTLLCWNADLPGSARLALAGEQDTPVLAAEIPLDEDDDTWLGVEAAIRGLHQAFARLRTRNRGIGSGENSMAPVAESPPGVIRDLSAACREAGWSFTEKEHGMLWVNLETPTGTTNFRAQVRNREAEGVRIMAILAQFDSLSRDSRHSLGHLLLRASGSLRLVRASAWTKSGEAGLAFEVFIPTRETPRPAEIDHALSALSVACSVCGTEAEALQDRVLARNYLRMRGRASHGNPNGSVAQKSAGGTKHGSRGNE